MNKASASGWARAGDFSTDDRTGLGLGAAVGTAAVGVRRRVAGVLAGLQGILCDVLHAAVEVCHALIQVGQISCDLLQLDAKVGDVLAARDALLLGRVSDLLFDARELSQRFELIFAHVLHLAAHLRHVLFQQLHLVGQDAPRRRKSQHNDHHGGQGEPHRRTPCCFGGRAIGAPFYRLLSIMNSARRFLDHADSLRPFLAGRSSP